jgi:hypothetical protein
MRVFGTFVCLCLAVQSVLAGQSNAGLRVQVVHGNGANNILENVPAQPVTVRVVDRESRPVQGARVTFTTPDTGPSGDFASGLNTLTTLTNEDGTAAALEFRPNEIPGAYEIQVRAEYLGEIATVAIRQTNVTGKKSMTKYIVLAAVAGAVVAVVSTRSGGNSRQPSSTSTSTAPTITFGSSSVTGP